MNEDADIFTIGDALAASDKKPKQRKKTKSSSSESTITETKPKKKSPVTVEKVLVDREETVDLSDKEVDAKLTTSEKVGVKVQFKDDKNLKEKSEKFEKDVSDLIKKSGMKDEYPLRKINNAIDKKSKNSVAKDVGIGVAVAAGVSMIIGFLLRDN